MTEKYHHHLVDGSVSVHCCFQTSLVWFAEPKTEAEVEYQMDYRTPRDEKRYPERILLETLEMTDEEGAAMLVWFRTKMEQNDE